MPDDTTPMHARYYDPWARTAWLLATLRSHGRETAFADRATFMDALRSAGVAADPSRVSRWESGQHAVSFRALRGYEEVLGVPEGALVAVHRQLVRESDPSGSRPERVSFSARSDKAPDALASELVDRAAGREDMTGGDWLRLATELEHFELVLLPSRTWAAICDRLVGELARSSGVDQLRRLEAITTLVGHGVAQRHVLHSLGIWFTDAAVQVINPMLGLLQHLEDRAASALVLKFIDADSKTLSLAAIQVAAAKLGRGHMETGSIALLEQHAIRGLVARGSKRSADLLDLICHLPEDSFDRVTGTLKDGPLRQRVLETRDTFDLAQREASRSVSRQVATFAQSVTPAVYATEPDQMLQRLVCESLFHVSSTRRRLAVSTLGLSPYAPAVADCFISLIGSDRELLGDRAWEAVWMLGCGTRRGDIGALLHSESAWTRRRALITLARAAEPLNDDERQAVSRAARHGSESVRRAALYAMGLQSADLLPTPLETQDHPDADVVRWWRRVGPAVRDKD